MGKIAGDGPVPLFYQGGCGTKEVLSEEKNANRNSLKIADRKTKKNLQYDKKNRKAS